MRHINTGWPMWEYRIAVLLALLVVGRHLFSDDGAYLWKLLPGGRTALWVTGAGLVALIFPPLRIFIFALIFYVIYLTQMATMAAGLVLGVRNTAIARKTKTSEDRNWAIMAWAAFLLMADYCLTTGTASLNPLN